MAEGSRHEGEWPFYGRESSLERIETLLSNATFSASVVHGRRGVGKTRLLREAGRRHLAAGGRPTVICERVVAALRDWLVDPAPAQRDSHHLPRDRLPLPVPGPSGVPVVGEAFRQAPGHVRRPDGGPR